MKTNCIRPKMFTTKGTARVGHASDITLRKISFGKLGISIEIRSRINPDYKSLTTLEYEEMQQLFTWLQMQLATVK